MTASLSAITSAAQRLREGGVVAFPTETVYGLGADALSERAVRRVYELKGRPAHNPLIVHVSGDDMARRVTERWPPQAQRLSARFWPGALTIVAPAHATLPRVVTGGAATVAVRCPDHPLALALIEAFGGPIVGPSANLSGFVSPTRAEHVRAAFDERDVMVLDGGPCRMGIESTVLLPGEDDQPARILRAGAVTSEDLLAAGVRLAGDAAESADAEGEAGTLLQSPGLLPSHYAPRSRAMLIEPEDWSVEATGLPDAALRALGGAPGAPVAVLSHLSKRRVESPHTLISLPADAADYARALYHALRSADEAAPSLILIDVPTARGGLWEAIRDRLMRAAAPR